MNDKLTIHTADAVKFSLEIVGLGGRSHAFLIDWHIRLLFALAWALVTFTLFKFASNWLVNFSPTGEGNGLIVYIISLPGLFIYFFYHPVLEILMHGRTPGKRMAGIRIVSSDGKTPGIGAVLIRNLFRLIDSLPTLYVIGIVTTTLTKQHVRIGDLAAGTLLVYEDNISQESLNEATQLALTSGLSNKHQDLLLEILERWKSLETPAKISIGSAFLNKIGHTVPENSSQRQLSQLIHKQLLALKENE